MYFYQKKQFSIGTGVQIRNQFNTQLKFERELIVAGAPRSTTIQSLKNVYLDVLLEFSYKLNNNLDLLLRSERSLTNRFLGSDGQIKEFSNTFKLGVNYNF